MVDATPTSDVSGYGEATTSTVDARAARRYIHIIRAFLFSKRAEVLLNGLIHSALCSRHSVRHSDAVTLAGALHALSLLPWWPSAAHIAHDATA